MQVLFNIRSGSESVGPGHFYRNLAPQLCIETKIDRSEISFTKDASQSITTTSTSLDTLRSNVRTKLRLLTNWRCNRVILFRC